MAIPGVTKNPYLSDHGDLATEFGSSHRLVRALATAPELELLTAHRLSGLGEPLHIAEIRFFRSYSLL